MSKKLKGLNPKQALEKLKQYGKNEIKKTKKISPTKILFLQFKSPLIVILIIATAISFFVNYQRGEKYIDSILIIIIILASGIAGFIQDYKAEEAIEALKKMSSPKAKVLRDGKEMEIKTSDIVPGDLILLEGGDIIPADSKIIEGKAEVNESVLSGESRSIHKKENDDLYSSCSVLSGRVTAEVYATAMKTKVGMIAEKMQNIKEDETPFQKHMKKFTNKLVLGTGLIIILTFIAGVGKFGALEASLIAVSLAVAAIPEGLPAVITLALSLGAKSMVAKNALIRKMSITESIGSINTICTDKTGTLTEGNMKVKDVWCPGNNNSVKTLSYQCSYYCNDAKKIYKEGEKKWVGDETDIALKKYSSKKIEKEGERKGEISFTSERKMMTVMQELEEKNIIFTKGAPEIVIEECQFLFESGKNKILGKKEKKEILDKNKELASKGFRILALAFKDSKELSENKLVFISLIYLNDPVRLEAKKSVKECQSAGIRTIMITGDNPLTAQAIANEVNITSDNVYIGKDLDKMRGAEIDKILAGNNNIFARTSPFHKLRILTSLKNQGYIVAMTGDGVNDALALKKSDVGVAMGIKGTEVSKEASDIILLDDNFATIRNSILEGRRIFDNIRKFVNYLLTCNLAEVVVILTLTLTVPFIVLYPIQILWINLITDGLVALALSIDPAKPDIMKRKPRHKNEGIINKKLGLLIITGGILKSIILLIIFFTTIKMGEEISRTILFTGFILFEFIRIVVIKYNENLKSTKDWFANKFLIFSLVFSLALQLIIIYTPLATYFDIVPLGTREWFILAIFSLAGLLLGILFTKIINKFVD